MKIALDNALQLWSINWRHRHMILQMVRRELAGRYRGSMFGVAWSVIQPLMMLMVYTFAFNVVFKSRWSGTTSSGDEINFAVAMFIGFIIYTLFSECLNRAPSLILAHANYVKKVVFPLEILATVTVVTALCTAGIAFSLWIGLMLVFHQGIPATILLLPIVLLPLLLMIAGLVWFLSSLGVFVRDLGQLVSLGTLCLLFLSPIFYPTSAIPDPFQLWIKINPLTGVIEEARKVAIVGQWPDWGLLGMQLLAAAIVAHTGFVWFIRTRWGFADVL